MSFCVISVQTLMTTKIVHNVSKSRNVSVLVVYTCSSLIGICQQPKTKPKLLRILARKEIPRFQTGYKY